jgi:hypothetical protein
MLRCRIRSNDATREIIAKCSCTQGDIAILAQGVCREYGKCIDRIRTNYGIIVSQTCSCYPNKT